MSKLRKSGVNPAFTITLIVITLLNLFTLFFMKYRNHGLSLSEFSFSIGNFLNIFFAVLLCAGLVLAYKWKTSVKGVTVYIILMSLFLFSTAFVNLLNFPLPEYYLFNHPVEDILVVTLFLGYQFAQFMAVSVLWTKQRKKKMLHLKAAVNSLLLFVILMIFAFFFARKTVETGVKESKYQNVGVVLGAAVWSYDKPSPSLSSRIDRAVELYDAEQIQKVQLTGSNAPGELSEAEVAFRYIITKGVGPEDVFFENTTTSTSEQVKYIKETLVNGRDLFNIVIISDTYHLPRIREITKFYNIKTDLAASRLTLSQKDRLYYSIRESIGLIIFWLFAL